MSRHHCYTNNNLGSLKKHVSAKFKHSTKNINNNIDDLGDDVDACCDIVQANISLVEGQIEALSEAQSTCCINTQSNIQNSTTTLEERMDDLESLLVTLQNSVNSILECSCVIH